MNNVNEPLVSVIMGVYNSEKTLSECIESVIAQTYENWEFIICDDGSVDKSYEIVKKYAEIEPRIKPIKNKSNKGLPYTLNHCISNSAGKYFVRQDADDIMFDQRIEKQIAFMEQNQKYAVVGSSMYLFDDNDIWGIRTRPEKPDKKTFLKGNPFWHPTVIMKADIIKEIGGYSESGLAIKRLEDIELWFRLYSKGYYGYNIQEPLHKFREDRQAYNRRKLSHRWYSVIMQLQGFRKLSLPYWSFIFALKPLLAGITPVAIMRLYHRKRDGIGD
jgi:glycosyltransferase EpsE